MRTKLANTGWLLGLILVSLIANGEEKKPMPNNPVGHIAPSDKVLSLAPSQRMHLILLGVKNISKSASFYEALGWKRSPTSNDSFVKFDMGGYAICLQSREDFAKDALFDTSKHSGFPGIALAYLTKSAEEVPRILAKAAEAGGTILKPATRTPWGVAGYFTDPDGHLFEVDFEEAWAFDGAHRLIVDKVN